jgi:mono/diheme cytochrome c family protein
MKNYFLLFLAALLAMPVLADKAPIPSDAPQAYETECASCHMAFPPGLLSQRNWLVKNAASKYKYSALAPDNRISKSAWFIKEHNEVRAEVWKRPGVKSAANCMACHKDAASGGFSEKNVQVPAK